MSNKNIVKNVTLLGGTLYTSNLNQNNERNIENAPRNKFKKNQQRGAYPPIKRCNWV